MATGLTAMWNAMENVGGDRTIPLLSKAFNAYDPYDDPKYIRDMEMFKQNPTEEMAGRIIQEYGDYIEVDDFSDLASSIRPLEGTTARMEDEALRSGFQTDIAQSEYDLDRLELTDPSLEAEATNVGHEGTIAQGTYNIELTEGLDAGLAADAQNMGNQLSLVEGEARIPYYETRDFAGQAEAENVADRAGMEQSEFNLNYYNALDPELQASVENLANQLNIDQTELERILVDARTEDVDSIIEEERTARQESIATSELGTEQATSQIPFVEELTQINAQNARNEAKQSALSGFIAGRKNEILQNMSDEELYNYLFGIGDEGAAEMESPEMQNYASILEDRFGSTWGYAGRGQNGELVFQSVRGGRMGFDTDGNLVDYTDRPLSNEVTINPVEFFWNSREAQATMGTENIQNMFGGELDREMSLSEATSLIRNLLPNYDISQLYSASTLGGSFDPPYSSERIREGNIPEDYYGDIDAVTDTIISNYDEATPSQVADAYRENYTTDEEKAELEEMFGVSFEEIVNTLEEKDDTGFINRNLPWQ